MFLLVFRQVAVFFICVLFFSFFFYLFFPSMSSLLSLSFSLFLSLSLSFSLTNNLTTLAIGRNRATAEGQLLAWRPPHPTTRLGVGCIDVVSNVKPGIALLAVNGR